jgi:hypothetical protein
MDLIASSHTYHSLYLAVHRAHLADSDTWNSAHCTRVMTAIMGARKFSWRVIGITEAALRILRENGYKRKDGDKITRAHLRERSTTVKELLAKPELSEADFFKFWTKHDPVVLCGPGENKKVVSPYIAIENERAELFSSGTVSWRHGQLERDFLAALYEARFGVPGSV